MSNTQKLSIRLLREDIEPSRAVKAGVELKSWPRFEGALFLLDTVGGYPPKWLDFLNLRTEEAATLRNQASLGVVFLRACNRWFAVTFGIGHSKLDLSAFVLDFGLRVVLNAVDPMKLKSADIRTPDENTLSRRTQTSRASDQSAFSFEPERDLVRGMAGRPRDEAFGSYIAGTDVLTLNRKLDVNELQDVCEESFVLYQQEGYRDRFGWIDKVRHLRDPNLIKDLDSRLLGELNEVITGGTSDSIHFAYPMIYDPEAGNSIRFRGFRCRKVHPDLDIHDYVSDLREQNVAKLSRLDLDRHKVCEVNEDGDSRGSSWKIYECLVYESTLSEFQYVLSGGRWYRIDRELATQAQEFFQRAEKIEMPPALPNENEVKYNRRLASTNVDMLCLDGRLIKPTGAANPIEICDFISRKRELIHIKYKTSSSRLSHLFNQGTVSARVIAVDQDARHLVHREIKSAQDQSSLNGFDEIMAFTENEFQRSDYTIVYAVIGTGDTPRLPFFSLISFRQAVEDLQVLGFKCAFAWIEKPR